MCGLPTSCHFSEKGAERVGEVPIIPIGDSLDALAGLPDPPRLKKLLNLLYDSIDKGI